MKFGSSLAIAFLFFSVIVTGFCCKRNNGHAVENVVYYYPEKNVYYDSLQAKYYYSLDGARSWDSMAFKGPGYGAVLGKRVPVKRTAGNVWINNPSHRKVYNGALLNLVNSQTILISKADSINKIKTIVIVKTKPAVIEKAAPPEKGLKKFFNNLFGKKKKPAEENKQ